MGLSSGATSASTSSRHRTMGLPLSGSSTQKIASLALMKSSRERFLKVSACLSFSAWMIGWPPISDMRMPLEFVSRMVLPMPSMISFLTSSFSFFPAAIASSSACLACFFAAASNALPFLSVDRLKREFRRAAFCTSFCLASFSLRCWSSIPPLGAPAALLWMDLMYFCTTLLLFLFLSPKVLSTAIFSFSFCLALSAFGGILPEDALAPCTEAG
mmetsp:Transcript_40035/g.124762  ORF Transcript_40035/g.124762 Transcript_40035/m.124762 type:complete len:215 (+) Transcript_40035:408-1052(+)